MNRRFHFLIIFAFGVCVSVVYFVAPQTLPRGFQVTTKDQVTPKDNYHASGCYDIGVHFTSEEASVIKRCANNFKEVRKERRLINSAKMERDRWTKHTYLLADSRIVEVGGFKGVDAEKFINLVNPYYIALEPVPEYNKILENKFGKNPKFTLYKFGLAKENKTIMLNFTVGDATSLFGSKQKRTANKVQILKIRSAKEFFTSIGVQQHAVDLLHINCEGCEYELLEFLIADDFAKYFKHIQFQFHLDLPGLSHFECRYCQIMQLLRRSHTPMFQYSYTWQSWQLR